MYSQSLIKLAKRTKLLEGNGCCDYKTRCHSCPLNSITQTTVGSRYNCSGALTEYIDTKLTPEEKLEFLIAVYN